MNTLTATQPSEPFALSRQEKRAHFACALSELTRFHDANCNAYRRILHALDIDPTCGFEAPENVPFLPVRLFKTHPLASVPESAITKTMTSSGTTGQQVSRIFLDAETAATQTKVLTRIVGSFLGKKRLPMLIIDTKAILKDRALFSARGAGILGFSMFGRDLTYALTPEMQPDVDTIGAFMEKHQGQPILVFGFTYMIWQHLLQEVHRQGLKINAPNGILIHGGGWKKLASQAVDNDTFKQTIADTIGIRQVHNYYGMVEQTGSIFMECEAGHLHCSDYSDIIIRDHRDFASLGVGQVGLIQLVSLLPKSYPGHSILSEDTGEILGEDDCPCGRQGKYFRIHGRIKNAEIRGCSDTYAASH